jgi:hypothetical protein
VCVCERPFAHFKELWEACQLLVLPEEDVATIEECIESAGGGGGGSRQEAEAVLRRYGVKKLELEQAEFVLAHRL